MRKGDKVQWESQSNGSTTKKAGTIIRLLKAKDYPPVIARKEFPNHKRMFDGMNPPVDENGTGYLVEVITSPRAMPRLYMPRPKNLQKIEDLKEVLR